MKRIMEAGLIGVLAATMSMAFVGCHQTRAPKKSYSEIYHGTNGMYYARSYSDGNFWFWMYVLNGDNFSTTSLAPGSRSYFSSRSGNWTRVASAPSGLKPTGLVVEQEQGKPSQEVEAESEVPADETINEEMTSGQAENAESSSTEAGGSGSGDDSGGGDAGGGDGGE